MTTPGRATPLLALGCLLAGLVAGCASSAGPGGRAVDRDGGVPLAWKWNEGDVRRYRVTEESDTTLRATVFPAPVAYRTTEIYELTHEVEHVAHDGVARVLVTFDRLDVSVGLPDGTRTTQWSSDDADGPLPERIRVQTMGVDSLIGRSLALWIDERGEAVEIEGSEDLVSDLVEHSAGERPQELQDLLAFFSEDALLELAGLGVLVFPDPPIELGDAWTDEFASELPVVGGFEMRQTFALESVEGRQAILSLEGELGIGRESTSADELGLPPVALEGVEMEIETERGELDGTIRFDLDRGLLVTEEDLLHLALTLTMTPSDDSSGPAEPMVLEAEVRSRTLWELIEEQ